MKLSSNPKIGPRKPYPSLHLSSSNEATNHASMTGFHLSVWSMAENIDLVSISAFGKYFRRRCCTILTSKHRISTDPALCSAAYRLFDLDR